MCLMPGSDTSSISSITSASSEESTSSDNQRRHQPIDPSLITANPNHISNLTQTSSTHITTRKHRSNIAMTAVNQIGVHHLPVPGTKDAPKKFKGKFSKIKLFIKHYEKLCIQKSVTNEEEKVQNITQYCSRSVREFMEGLPSYKTNNWEAFVQDLLEYYDAERDIKRYRRGDLEAYCRHMRHIKSTMRMPHWKSYNRKFIRIAGWLEAHNKISEEEKALYFWKGIPLDFREKLEARLLAIEPDHDLENPFEIGQVSKVAKSLLQRNRFDNEYTLSDDEESDESDSEEEDSDSESESDSDKELFKSKKSKSRSSSKDSKKVRFKSTSQDKDSSNIAIDKNSEAKSNKELNKVKEVEDLIDQMNRLSIHDPAYSVLYYRAYNLDPMIADIVMKPVERQQIAQRMRQNPSPNRLNANSTTPGSPSTSFTRATPPHLKPGSNAFQQPTISDERRCFGCGGSGHTMFFCAKMSELVTQGIITKDGMGKYVMADGSFIRKASYDEPLVEAIERLRPVQANYIAISSMSMSNSEDDHSDEDDSDTDEEVFVATRSMAKSSQPRKSTSEKVFSPARKRHEESHPRFSEKKKTENKAPTQEEPKPVPNIPTPIVVDKTIFNPNNDDAFMEDATSVQKSINEQKSRPITTTKRIPKQSEVQTQVDQMNVLSRILNQPITLAIGEVFGISKEMTSNLREVLKPKPTQKPIMQTEESAKVNLGERDNSMVAAATVFRAKETLIRLKMECEGMPITAIIDTGSQLNIAHRNVWKEVLSRPLDTQSTVNMNDANGGASKLSGLVSNVPLTCGGVKTVASLYIGDKVPFDLLLGRPWQRGNFVSIDERPDGTYLIFKDRDMNPRHEILVTPDEHLVEDPNIADFIHKARDNRFSVHSITTEKELSDKTTAMVAYIGEGQELEEDKRKKTKWIPSKRRTPPAEDLTQMAYKRLKNDNDSKDSSNRDLEISSTLNPEKELDIPGLLWPETDKEAEKLEELWKETKSISSLDEKQKSDNGLTTDDNGMPSLGRIELVQILEKSSTKDWRSRFHWKGNDQHHQRAVRKARKRRGPIKLLSKAVENLRIHRIWGLVRSLRESDTAIRQERTENNEYADSIMSSEEIGNETDDIPREENHEIWNVSQENITPDDHKEKEYLALNKTVNDTYTRFDETVMILNTEVSDPSKLIGEDDLKHRGVTKESEIIIETRKNDLEAYARKDALTKQGLVRPKRIESLTNKRKYLEGDLPLEEIDRVKESVIEHHMDNLSARAAAISRWSRERRDAIEQLQMMVEALNLREK